MRFLSALLVVALGVSITMPTLAQDSSTPAKRVTRQALKKAAPKKAESAAHSDAAAGDDDDDDKAPDVTSSASTEFECELGNTVTIYRNVDDTNHIALRWKKQILRLKRVVTTTGANRFENRRSGWVWIDIPAKSMLLDAKKGQQLVNECRNPDQLKANAEEAVRS